MMERLAERPGAAADAGLGVVFAAVLAVEVLNVAGHHPNRWYAFAVAVVVCVAALLREHSRTWAATAGLAVSGAAELAAWRWDVPSQPGVAAALALFVLMGSAVRVLPVRTASAIAAGGAVVAIGTIERYLVFIDHGTRNNFTATKLMLFGWGAAVGAGLWLRVLDARRRAVIEKVRRGERLELARELHDTAAHHITGIVLQAQAARIVARRAAAGGADAGGAGGGENDGRDDGGDGGGGQAGTLDDSLAGIEAAGTEALASMRRVIGLLRDTDDAAGLTPGPEQLAVLVERFAGRGPAVRLHLPDGPADPAWPLEVTATVSRVVQEALTNITRHASGAREVTVVLGHDQEAISIEITDDAPPAGSPRFPHTGGYGLVGMRERVEALGGTLSAGPSDGAGWSVLATLPAPGRP